MTTCASWLAIRGKDAASVRPDLAVDGGEVVETELPGGWKLWLADNADFADAAPHATLSAGCELITCAADERLMYSSISGWRDGVRQYYIVHDGQFGIQHIHVEGEPPPEFFPIYNRLSVDQAEAGGLSITVDHVYEVPLALAKALTGYRHDEA